jgi:hypothetical protein
LRYFFTSSVYRICATPFAIPISFGAVDPKPGLLFARGLFFPVVGADDMKAPQIKAMANIHASGS